MARLRAKSKQLLEQHHHTKQDTYIGGRFLVRGTCNASALDRWVGTAPPKKENPYTQPKVILGILQPEGRELTAWKLLQRFYINCRRPIATRLMGVKTFSTFWVLVYPCSFYVSVQKGSKMVGEHVVTLWYSSSFKKNFPIASTTFEGHFKGGAPQAMSDFIRETILCKEFFQSHESKIQKIPL